jgi:hypothetical protein
MSTVETPKVKGPDGQTKARRSSGLNPMPSVNLSVSNSAVADSVMHDHPASRVSELESTKALFFSPVKVLFLETER